jgi:phage-related tail fiber protein
MTATTSAHSAICSCYDNADGTITCEGGFSDGGSAAGVSIRIVDPRDRVLIDGVMADDGTFTFDRPDGEFNVVFDAGQSHIVTIFSGDIEE